MLLYSVILSLSRMNEKAHQGRLLAWILLFTLVLVWGSSFILIKKGLEVFPVLELGTLRITFAFLVLLPLTFKRFSKVPAKKWVVLILVGIIGSGIPAFLFAKAQTGIYSNLAAILNSMTPLFTLIIALSFFRFRTRWFNIAGILLPCLEPLV